MRKTKILVVDDELAIVKLVRAALKTRQYETLAVMDGVQALKAIEMEQPDLVLLDLMLPDRDGWQITRLLRSDPATASTSIIMLTARVEDIDKIAGLELGADDYITKPFTPQVVVAHVRAVLRRTTAAPAQRRLLRGPYELLMDLDRHEVSIAGRPVNLTPTEFEFLRALMEYPDHAFTRLELIESALGYRYEGLERTVDSHIKNLRCKI